MHEILTFNNSSETRGIYCNEHIKEGMIDVKNRRCQEEGCTTSVDIPNFLKLKTKTRSFFFEPFPFQARTHEYLVLRGQPF